MIRQTPLSLPYLIFSITLLVSTMLFGVSLWRDIMSSYSVNTTNCVPGFTVYADGGRAIRIIPLAGAALRSPIVTLAEAPIHLVY